MTEVGLTIGYAACLSVRVCCVLELVSSLSPVLLLPPCRVVTKEAVPEGYLEEGFP